MRQTPRMTSTWLMLLVLAAGGLAAPIARSHAGDAPAPRPTAVNDKPADVHRHAKKTSPRGADADRGASTERRSDDPTRGRNTGDAKQSGPGSGAGL